jgi:hypothetical protein
VGCSNLKVICHDEAYNLSTVQVKQQRTCGKRGKEKIGKENKLQSWMTETVKTPINKSHGLNVLYVQSVPSDVPLSKDLERVFSDKLDHQVR